MKPLVKYRGGKSKEIKTFNKYIPEDFDTYIEPFVGGGAVYFYLEPRKAIINDINSKLMMFYNDLKYNYKTLRQQLDFLDNTYKINQDEYEVNKSKDGGYVINKNEQLYYSLREDFNHPTGKWLNSTLYYFINKTAYSGMIRYNKNGEYNVPFGRYKNFNTKLITEEHHQLLKRTEIFCTDYSEIFRLAKPNDFIFLDPPYDTIFNDYGNLEFNNGFNEFEHRRLATEFKKLKCKTLMVIGKTDLTYSLYKDYVMDEYSKRYDVNIRNRFSNEAKHIIVANYDIQNCVINTPQTNSMTR